MRILFTGASSFTGMWFVERLVEAGHEVVATFTRNAADEYDGIRAARVARLIPRCDTRFGVRFGDSKFLQLLSGDRPAELLCHHAADVTDYKSDDFDIANAVANNTRRIRELIVRLRDQSGRLLMTGSVFEGGEGLGSMPSRHFSPYGLSKAVSWQIAEHHATTAGLHLAKFVISNPFGPWEDPRFCNYLVQCWARGETPEIRTPDYVRDNIHVALLADAYAGFVAGLPPADTPGVSRLNPSGYVERQGCFAIRFAREMDARLPFECHCRLATQVDFDEPRIRYNTDPALPLAPDFEEARAWDELAAYYREVLGQDR